MTKKDYYKRNKHKILKVHKERRRVYNQYKDESKGLLNMIMEEIGDESKIQRRENGSERQLYLK